MTRPAERTAAGRADRPARPRGRRGSRPKSGGASGPPGGGASRAGARRRARLARPATPAGAQGSEEGDPRLDVVRRGRPRGVRTGLGRRELVRHDQRHVLDDQPEGIRGPAQARAGVPGPGPAREPGRQGARRGHRRGRRTRREAGSGRPGRGRRSSGCRRLGEPLDRSPPAAGPRRGRRPRSDPAPHDLVLVGRDLRRRDAASASRRAPPAASATRDRAARPRPRAPRLRGCPPAGPPPIDGLSGRRPALTQGAPPSFGWRIARAAIGWLPDRPGHRLGRRRGLGLRPLCRRPAVTRPSRRPGRSRRSCSSCSSPCRSWPAGRSSPRIVSLVVAVPATLFVTASAGARGLDGRGRVPRASCSRSHGSLGIVGAIVLGRRRSFDPTGPVS